MAKKKTRKNTKMAEERTSLVRKGVLAAILVVLMIALIGGTYARYTKSVKTYASISVAKWAIKMTDKDSNAISDTKQLDFVLDSNANVKDGKIAPSSSATCTAIIDTTGTEVATTLTSTIDSTSLKAVFGDAADRVTLTMTVDNKESLSGSSVNIPLSDIDMAHSVSFKLSWIESNDDTENGEDSTVGIGATTISLPVTLTATQTV